MKNRCLSLVAVCVAASLVVLLAGCFHPGPSVRAGSLTVSIKNLINARTLLPPISMDAASYTVEGEGPNGASFSRSSSGEAVTVEELTYGTWVVTVNALNAEGTIIGKGENAATLSQGQTATLEITVTPLGGRGSLDLSVSWTASLQNPSIQASLTPPIGSALEFGISGNQATCSSAAIPAGYYTLTVQLLESSIPVMGAVEVVRIVSGQTTSGAYDFTHVNMGTVEVNITPALANPIPVKIDGVLATLSVGTSMTVNASVSDGTPDVTYVWYVNGVSKATGPSPTFGSDLSTGYYRLDVTAFTADGLRGGSATANFQVRKASTDEYFISFKFDGTPVTFTKGVLEAGNVPLVAVETGREVNGHLYDRTHIIAYPTGLPLSELPQADTFIEIVLIGEPGTQPPPAGTYTYSDRIHGVENVDYCLQGLSYQMPSGSATVVLTTVGGVGGFIEGTFSATVLESPGTLAPHSITEGAFRVKRLALSLALSGTFASPNGVTVPDGIYGYLKLVTSGGLPTDPALYWTRSNAFSGGSASYSITGIAAGGTYTAYAFIDMNANAPNNATAMPDSSDYYSQTGQQISIPDIQTLNLGPGGWIAASAEQSWTYVGTWVNPEYNGGDGGPTDAPAKIVMTSNLFEFYDNNADTTPRGTMSFDLADDWTDAVHHYFKGEDIAVGTSTHVYFLIGVSDNNSTLRITSSATDYPTSLETSLHYSRQ